LRLASRQAARKLARLPNVVGISIGQKRTSGKPTGKLALIVHVSRKGDMPRADMIPGQISLPKGADLETDVNELAGAPRALAARSGDFVWSGDNDRGTSCLTFIKNGLGYVTTNAHVVSNVARSRFYLPNVMRPDGGTTNLTLGRLAYLSRFPTDGTAREDFAVIETERSAVEHLGMVGEAAPIAGISSFGSDLDSPYWYNVNGMRVTLESPEPSPNGVPTEMLVDRIWYPYENFWWLRVTGGHVAPGHSGAVICRGSGSNIIACGILFGGAFDGPQPELAYAFQLQPTFRRAYDLI